MAIVTNAQTWTTLKWDKSTPDENTLVKTAADGSVYIASVFNETFTFGSSTLTTDIENSGLIAKFNADETKAWAVGFIGSCTFTSIDTDAEGNIYGVAKIMDEVKFAGTDKVEGTVAVAEGDVATLVVKIDKDGVVKASKLISSSTDPEIAFADFPFYLGEGLEVIPNHIEVADNKVYLSVIYTGDIKTDNVDWKASYLLLDYMMYLDNRSAGILSLNANDLSGAESVANLQMTGIIGYDVQHYPEAINFTVDNGVVYAGFFGLGDLTLTTAAGQKDMSLNASSTEEGYNEHPFILATINRNETIVNEVHGTANDIIYNPYTIKKMVSKGDDLYIVGTFAGVLPFNKEKAHKGYNDLFAVSINKNTAATNWSCTSEFDESSDGAEVATVLLVSSDKVFVSGYASTQSEENTTLTPLSYNIDATGTATTGDTSMLFVDADDNGKGLTAVSYINVGAQVHGVALYESPTTNIQTVKTAVKADDKAYNLNGQQVTTPSKGLYIVNGKKVLF